MPVGDGASECHDGQMSERLTNRKIREILDLGAMHHLRHHADPCLGQRGSALYDLTFDGTTPTLVLAVGAGLVLGKPIEVRLAC